MNSDETEDKTTKAAVSKLEREMNKTTDTHANGTAAVESESSLHSARFGPIVIYIKQYNTNS